MTRFFVSLTNVRFRPHLLFSATPLLVGTPMSYYTDRCQALKRRQLSPVLQPADNWRRPCTSLLATRPVEHQLIIRADSKLWPLTRVFYSALTPDLERSTHIKHRNLRMN